MDKLKSMFNKHEQTGGTPTSSSTAPASGSAAGDSSIPSGVMLHTTLGDITIALYRDETPKVRPSLFAPPSLPSNVAHRMY